MKVRSVDWFMDTEPSHSPQQSTINMYAIKLLDKYLNSVNAHIETLQRQTAFVQVEK